MSEKQISLGEYMYKATSGMDPVPETVVLTEVKRRVDGGESVDATEEDGDSTAVMRAAFAGYLSVTRFLIEAGANLSLKDRWKEDVMSCAKLSENKEVIALVRAALKGSGASASIVLYYRPKDGTEAEYTFYPNKKFKVVHDAEADDVGFFLKDNEVLKLEPTKKVSTKADILTIPIEEGKVTIWTDQWDIVEEKALKKLKLVVHDIDKIINEYLTD